MTNQRTRTVRWRYDVGRTRRLLRDAVADPAVRADVPRRVVKAARQRFPVLQRSIPTRVALPRVDLPPGPVARAQLRVAVILDTFSELCFRYEWDQVAVAPQTWRSELTARPPHLLFVESAWSGNDGAWRLAMSAADGPSVELRELVEWCRGQGIPTVFWNKEDPPNYDRFIDTARLFDRIFTVDADRIPDYRRDLGHDRLALLPFAAQPRVHNPIERGSGRVRKVAFAGTYFADKHPERRAQLQYLLGGALDSGLDIFSRMENGDRRYRFPREFRRHIAGSLPYEQMLGAYGSYEVFLNVNSVTGSPTMCSRRLFELSAAQAAVVTAPAASIPAFFGDALSVVADEDSARRAITALAGNREWRDRQALRAHRRVFDEHLVGHRVDTVLAATGLPVLPLPDVSVSAVVPTMRPDRLAEVFAFVGRQAHPDVELVLVPHGYEPAAKEIDRLAERHGVTAVEVVPASSDITLGQCMNLGVAAASGRYIAKMDDDNFYAPHYLSDLVRAFSWTDAEAVGKWAHYVHLAASEATLLRFADREHRYTDLVQGGTIMTPREVAMATSFEDLPRRVDTTFLQKIRRDGGRVYSSDRFNFVSMRGADPDAHTWPVSDVELLARSSSLVFYGDPVAHVTV